MEAENQPPDLGKPQHLTIAPLYRLPFLGSPTESVEVTVRVSFYRFLSLFLERKLDITKSIAPYRIQ